MQISGESTPGYFSNQARREWKVGNSLFMPVLVRSSQKGSNWSVGRLYKRRHEMAVFMNFFFRWLFRSIQGPGLLFSSVNIFTQTVGLLGWVISSSQGLDLNTGQSKNRINAYTHQTPMPWVGFEPTIPASERAKTDHALDRAATVTGVLMNYPCHSNQRPLSIMYDILSLTNSTHLTAYMIIFCTKKPVPNSWFSFHFPLKNVRIRLLVQCHLRPIW
jgi:hypothetical protein